MAFRLLLEIMDTDGFQFQDERTQFHAKTVKTTQSDVNADEAFSDKSVRDAIKAVWSDSGMQHAITKRQKFSSYESLILYVTSTPQDLFTDYFLAMFRIWIVCSLQTGYRTIKMCSMLIPKRLVSPILSLRWKASISV